MSDLISRADAIDAVAEEWLSEASAESPYVNDDDIGEYRKLAEELFEDIPSADAVSREQYDCVCEEYNRLVHKAVCTKLCDENCEYEKGNTCYHAREHYAVDSVLSADAVQGEWLEIEDYNGDYHYQCSVCKDEFYLEYGTPKENGYAYCPSCGARMTPYKGGDPE